VIVEAVRLLVTLSTTAIGFQIGRSWPDWFPAVEATGDVTVIWGAVLGAGIGYVGGGALGRGIAHSLEEAPRVLAKTTGIQLFAGGFGLVAGVIVGTVLAVPLVLLLPTIAGWPLAGLLVLVLGAFGTRVFAARAQELLAFGPGHTLAPSEPPPASPGERWLIDSSAAIDGRVLELVRAGVIQGSVWVPAFVVDELQAIADSADKSKRRRGRRGLEILDAIRELEDVSFAVVEDTVPEYDEVDAKLLALTERAEGTLVTTDHNLGKAASIRGVRMLNPHALGESLRPQLNAGDPVVVRIEKEGSEQGQGVGFLEDGTMVVVAGASAAVGQTVEAEVSNLLRTSVGRMIFARMAG
jgi:uncharacterized protein YacL